jgi:antibiotic biosynthesis monooxygenase (ABM) superfamily enzyme
LIVSVLSLPIRLGCESETVQFYTEHDVFALAAQVGGFRSGKLLRPSEPGAPFLVIAEWDDAGAYDRWLAAPARAELSSLLGPLLDGDPRGGTYEQVAIESGPDGGPDQKLEATT